MTTMEHSKLRIFVDESGKMTLVDVHGYEIATEKLSVNTPYSEGEMAAGVIVVATIPGVKIERGSPRSIPTHYVSRGPLGGLVFVKEAEFFRSQGGLSQPWGKAWVPVTAVSIEEARRIGEEVV